MKRCNRMQQRIINENTTNNKPWKEAGNHCLLLISKRIRSVYLAAGKIRSMITWKMNTPPSPYPPRPFTKCLKKVLTGSHEAPSNSFSFSAPTFFEPRTTVFRHQVLQLHARLGPFRILMGWPIVVDETGRAWEKWEIYNKKSAGKRGGYSRLGKPRCLWG